MTLRTFEKVSPTCVDWDWDDLWTHCHRITCLYLRGPGAEDAAQEAMLRAWTAADRATVRDPKAWLARVARNEALRVVERERVLAGRHATLEVDLMAADEWEGSLHDGIEALAGLTSLPLLDRQVLRLRYLEDLTQTDVAHRLGIPEGTAKVRLYRARQRLKRELKKGRQ
ncbi:MAG: sigma-70 family RNA polymerase sigma factor [Thermoleophilaceae bacterium]|nr:sigma-70 family RNA polymerase sigma factor [Thermoleophilaceae bacterium]